jgi:formylglycine-generating enzyme required for sulfatase activity
MQSRSSPVVLIAVLALAACGGELRGPRAGGKEEPATDALPEGAPERLGEMVLVPAGPSVMGYDKGKRFERPQHTVVLSAFEIDIYEVTNYEYRRFVLDTGHETPPHWIDGTYPWDRDFHPVTNIRWDDALAYATWAGKRLPTEAEWEKACRGPEGLLYPYGDEFDQAITNNGTARAAEPVRVDAFPENKSHYGCQQMAGNVWEFVSDWFSLEYYADGQVDPRGPKSGTMHVSKGGSWTTDAYVCRASFRCRSLPGARWGYCGFRCARSVVPDGEGQPTTVHEMALIPAGTFLMGFDGDFFTAPEREIWLDEYRIDKMPVTNRQYLAFCREAGHPTPPHWHAARAPQGLEKHPVINVTIEEARAYATWAGKALPTEAQWEKAARGTDGRQWPWGDEFDETLSNGRLAKVGYTVEVGTYPGGASPYGVLGMCGNVWEWVEGRWDPTWRKGMPDRNPNGATDAGRLVLKGGTWSTSPWLCRTFSRSQSLRGGRWGYCGFRCVVDPRTHPDGLPAHR